jgi:hypothetical protein
MKKNIIYTLALFCTLTLCMCKKNDDNIPLYKDNIYPDTIFGRIVYWGDFNINTNIGVNYLGGLGSASRASVNVSSISCDSNTFEFVLPILNEPNKTLIKLPRFSRSLGISDVKFEVGKFKFIDAAYGDKRNCKVDTFPKAFFYLSVFDGDDLTILAEYRIGKNLPNFIEITKMDTLNKDISGRFQATFLNTNPKKSIEAPDTISINCTSFKIPWGKKRNG